MDKRIVLSLVALGAVGCAVQHHGKNDPPMTVLELRKDVDHEVRWTPEVVPQDQNGWRDAVKAVDLAGELGAPERTELKEINGSFDTLGPKSFVTRAKAAISPYDDALKGIAKALQKPRWCLPEFRDDTVPNLKTEAVIEYPTLPKLGDLGLVLALRAHLKLVEGKPADAVNDVLCAKAIGTKLCESHGTAMPLMVGASMESNALAQVCRLVRHPAWREADLARLLDGLPDRQPGADAAPSLKHEFDQEVLRMVAGLVIDDELMKLLNPRGESGALSKALAGHPLPYDRRQTARDAAQWLAPLLRNMEASWSRQEAVRPPFPELTKRLTELGLYDEIGSGASPVRATQQSIEGGKAYLAKLDNPVGKLLLAQLCPAFTALSEYDRRDLTKLRATRAILAAAIYAKRHGSEPPTLDALVQEKLLPSVPLDPFNDQPLHYDAARHLIWSVGPDGKDDGGLDRPGDFGSNAHDFVLPTDGIFSRLSVHMPAAGGTNPLKKAVDKVRKAVSGAKP